METEIEAKFLDVNTIELRANLKQIGAVLEHSEHLMKRKNFDDCDCRLRKVGGWVRLRDEGDKVTLSYKQLNDRTLHGTKEVTTIVENFDKTNEFLEAIGFRERSYQETRREKWLLGESEITIDTWPWIPSFVEIESPAEEIIKDLTRRLGFKWEEALHGSVETAYQKYYDVTEDEVDDWESITFIPVPEWLEKKRKPLL